MDNCMFQGRYRCQRGVSILCLFLNSLQYYTSMYVSLIVVIYNRLNKFSAIWWLSPLPVTGLWLAQMNGFCQ
jgi:hypothetical protein